MGVFEDKYAMSSDEFLEQYCSGKLGDSRDFVNWAGLCRIHAASIEQAKSV